MDAFFASIEQLDDPHLRGKPVLVGGSGPRGVVAAASYEARRFGCHSAQPTAIALGCCPQAVVVPPRGRRYHGVSEQVFAVLDRFTPLVEPLSVDEAFLDVTGCDLLHGPAAGIAAAIKQRIRTELGLTASVGVAPNKFLAKLASDLDKPDGLTVIEAGEVEQRLEALPVGRMWGVGPVTERKLRDVGVKTFADLRAQPVQMLACCLGSHAQRMQDLAWGRDVRPVVPDGRAKSISQEQTFAFDLTDPEAVGQVLLGQVEQVARRLRKHGRRAGRATAKIRYGNFKTITRSATFAEPTDGTDELWRTGQDLFRSWARTAFQPVRLIGFGCSCLIDGGRQLHLFTRQADQRRRALDDVTDSIHLRYGDGAIHRGLKDH